jgi:hypothetical protein
VRDKVLINVEKALNFWVVYMNKNRVPLWRRVAVNSLKPNEDYQKEDGAEEETSLLTASGGWIYRFRNSFILKNFKIIGEAASIDEEAAATYLSQLNYQGGKIRF